MTIPRPAACALVLVIAFGTAARGQEPTDIPLPDPDPAAEEQFPWLCFATALATLGGLAVLVWRTAQRVGPCGPGTGWYCRACNRDVSGPECPHCRAPNVFLHDQEIERPPRGGGGARQRYD